MHRLRQYLAFAALLAIGPVGCPAQPGPGGGQTPTPGARTASPDTIRHWVSGYYVAYQRDLYRPSEIEWSGLTHLVMGRLKAKADGTLVTDFDVDAVDGRVRPRDDVPQALHPHARPETIGSTLAALHRLLPRRNDATPAPERPHGGIRM